MRKANIQRLKDLTKEHQLAKEEKQEVSKKEDGKKRKKKEE